MADQTPPAGAPGSILEALLSPVKSVREKNVSVEMRTMGELIQADEYARGQDPAYIRRMYRPYRQRLTRTGC